MINIAAARPDRKSSSIKEQHAEIVPKAFL
jgi:hypothetical protein